MYEYQAYVILTYEVNNLSLHHGTWFALLLCFKPCKGIKIHIMPLIRNKKEQRKYICIHLYTNTFHNIYTVRIRHCLSHSFHVLHNITIFRHKQNCLKRSGKNLFTPTPYSYKHVLAGRTYSAAREHFLFWIEKPASQNDLSEFERGQIEDWLMRCRLL